MTPTTVRMVLVEGKKADGVTVDHDVFEVGAPESPANIADEVVSAVLGTRESAQSGGHHLKSIGVTWSDHAEASALRDALAAAGIDDVMLVSEGHAAASLAQAVGQAVGYDTTALLFINRDAATLSVVQTDDGSVVKVLSRTLHSADAMAVLTEMAEVVAAKKAPPQGIFVVGSGVDVSSVKAHLEHLVALPVNAPEEADLALARGAALASASAPTFEASTVGLAYSKDPDGTTAGAAHAAPPGADTQLAPLAARPAELADDVVDEYAQTQARVVEEERKPFLLVGSALTSIFVVGVVALAISLAVSIRPTADQRPSPAEGIIVPSSQVPVPAPIQEAQQPIDPPPETIKPPVPVAQQVPVQAPRTVYVEQAPAPAPVAPPPVAPAPVAPPPVVAPPVIAPPVALPPVVILPQSQWPLWTPLEDSEPWSPSVPQVPQVPQSPQVPQQPQQSGGGDGPGDGSSGSGSSSGDGSASGSSGSGSSGGASDSGSTSSGSSGGATSSGSTSSGSSGATSGGSGSSGGSTSSGSSGASSGGSSSSGGSTSSGSSGASSSGSGSSGSSRSSGSSASTSSGSGSGGSDTVVGGSGGSGSSQSSGSSGGSGSSQGSGRSGGSSSNGSGSGGSNCFLILCASG